MDSSRRRLTVAEVTALRTVLLHEGLPPLTEAEASPWITHPLLIQTPCNRQKVTGSESGGRTGSKQSGRTVESLDAPHVVLGDVPLTGVGSVGMHQSLRISRVPQAEGVTDLVSRHLDQVVEPHPCGVT